MHVASFTHGLALPADAMTPQPRRERGLHVDAVLAHVARRVGCASDARARLIAAIEACAHLIAARQRLTLTLDVQHRIGQLVQLADGRERARRLTALEREALVSHHEAMREQAAQALAAWRDAGQTFASVTHLLPAQLPHQLPQMPPLTAVERDALARFQALTQPNELDAALRRCSDAEQRCDGAADRASAARALRMSAEFAWRMGRRRLPWLSQACLAELAAEEALLTAQATRAVAHGTLRVLAGNVGWGTSPGQEGRVREAA